MEKNLNSHKKIHQPGYEVNLITILLHAQPFLFLWYVIYVQKKRYPCSLCEKTMGTKERAIRHEETHLPVTEVCVNIVQQTMPVLTWIA